jgi:NAD(P)H dehydrogenase (quinone)
MPHVNVSVIYYSATGTVPGMVEPVAAVAEKTGASVRLRQVLELAPAEAIASDAAWSQHVAGRVVPVARRQRKRADGAD